MSDIVVSSEPIASSAEEREALQRVLESRLFQRAPNLSRILAYICEEHFKGNADKLKEYNIAVEALGRSAEFDPQLDAIVRVDLHLLRKKLREYYREAGKHDPLQIVLNAGSYIPEFVPACEKECMATAQNDTPTQNCPEEYTLPDIALTQPNSSTGVPLHAASFDAFAKFPYCSQLKVCLAATGFAFLALLTSLLIFVILSIHRAPSLLFIQKMPTPARILPATVLKDLKLGSSPDTLLDGIRIRCGSSADYIDSAGLRWQGDRDFTGGTPYARPVQSIQRSTDPALYSYGRQGVFQYDIPVGSGSYEVHLLFAETQPGVEDGVREVSYTVGLGQADSIDVVSDASGPRAATERVYANVRPGDNGKIHLNFWSTDSILNAIEILPDKNGKPQPVRISTLHHLYEDISGGHWLPDRYYLGGRNVEHAFARNQDAPPLLTRERYGNFNYAIPVAKGYKYQLTLYMSEHYWGERYSGLGGPGSRIYTVRCNGDDLLKNFDLVAVQKESSAVAVRFRNLVPDASGKLILSFVPVVNYPLVNAFEIQPE